MVRKHKHKVILKLTKQQIELSEVEYWKIYKIVDREMEYSDIDFEPDGSECVRDYQDAHDYIMNQLLNKLLR